jgi:hypothetical protein
MTMLRKPQADEGDRIADLILDAIDQEPEPIRARLLAAIKADQHHVLREPHRVVAYFPTVDKISYEIPLVWPQRRPRLDA